jgi:hypothetical protein
VVAHRRLVAGSTLCCLLARLAVRSSKRGIGGGFQAGAWEPMLRRIGARAPRTPRLSGGCLLGPAPRTTSSARDPPDIDDRHSRRHAEGTLDTETTIPRKGPCCDCDGSKVTLLAQTGTPRDGAFVGGARARGPPYSDDGRRQEAGSSPSPYRRRHADRKDMRQTATRQPAAAVVPLKQQRPARLVGASRKPT